MQFKKQVYILLISIALLFFIFCKYILMQQSSRSHKLYIMCTTTMIADAVASIAQNKVTLNILMGPGVDPHLYKPIEQDVSKIAQANIIFYNGLHLESRMADLFESMKHFKKTIAITRDIPLNLLIPSPEHEDFFDPHIWFDPELWSMAIKTITRTLQEHDPVNKDFYEQNMKTYLLKIQNMFDETKKQLLSIPKKKRILITAHDAFEYFARAYEFSVISLQGISTASEAGTKDVQQLANFIVEHKIPTIFIETSIPSRALQAVQQNVLSKNFQVHIGSELYSDALGEKNTDQGTYIGMMKYNIDAIIAGLQNKSYFE